MTKSRYVSWGDMACLTFFSVLFIGSMGMALAGVEEIQRRLRPQGIGVLHLVTLIKNDGYGFRISCIHICSEIVEEIKCKYCIIIVSSLINPFVNELVF